MLRINEQARHLAVILGAQVAISQRPDKNNFTQYDAQMVINARVISERPGLNQAGDDLAVELAKALTLRLRALEQLVPPARWTQEVENV